jgi:hypothetical protein
MELEDTAVNDVQVSDCNGLGSTLTVAVFGVAVTDSTFVALRVMVARPGLAPIIVTQSSVEYPFTAAMVGRSEVHSTFTDALAGSHDPSSVSDPPEMTSAVVGVTPNVTETACSVMGHPASRSAVVAKRIVKAVMCNFTMPTRESGFRRGSEAKTLLARHAD